MAPGVIGRYDCVAMNTQPIDYTGPQEPEICAVRSIVKGLAAHEWNIQDGAQMSNRPYFCLS